MLKTNGKSSAARGRENRRYPPGERVHPLGKDVTGERAAPRGRRLPQLDQALVHVVMAAPLPALRVQVQSPVAGVDRQPRAAAGREPGADGRVPLVRRPGRVPAQLAVPVRAGVPAQRVDRLVPPDVRVLHADLLAHVRDRGAGQQQRQRVHRVHHVGPEPGGHTVQVVVADLKPPPPYTHALPRRAACPIYRSDRRVGEKRRF